MAISTSSYFNNAIVGVPQVGADVNIFDSGTTPKFAVGTKFERQDGSVLRYAHFGAATVRGAAVATDISESCQADTDNVILAPASCVNTSDGTIGAYYVEITLASVTADMFAGGYFVTTDDTGEGYTYRVKGNTATDNPATGTFRLELYEPLQVAVDATTDFAINGSRWANLEGATTTDFDVSGVSVRSQDAGDFGWVLSKGVVGYLDSGGCTAGQAIAPSATAGALADAAAATENIVGICLIAGDNTGHSVGYINVD